MIKGIMGGQGIIVNGGNTTLPYVNMSQGPSGNPMQGMMRINGSDIQVFDGNNWMNLGSSYATVELNGEVQSIIQWARDERNKQLERTKLVKDNPALQNALAAIERAEANFDLIAKFVENDHGSESESVQSGP